jgi:hypothetical protein
MQTLKEKTSSELILQLLKVIKDNGITLDQSLKIKVNAWSVLFEEV